MLPAADSSSVADQRASKCRPSIPVETDFSIRPFTRQRRRSPCGSPVAGLTLLAYIFEIIPEVRPRPFGLSLPAPFGLLRLTEADHCDGTRCKAFLPGLFVCLQAATPLQDQRSFGIVVLTLTSDEDVCLCRLPDLLSLPAARPIIAYSTRASDHRSGFATSCQTRCSSKLLEPAIGCTHHAEESIEKRGFYQ